MKTTGLLIFGLILILSSCGPRVVTKLSKSYTPLDYRSNVIILGLKDPVPQKSEIIGTIKIGDTGFSTDCGYDVVIERAKMETRKAGGNAIKILQHTPPGFGSTCHKIQANILMIENINDIKIVEETNPELLNADYALLHFYRFSGTGALVGYDINLGDSVICRAKSNWKKTVKIKRDGLNTIWARTEAKAELPINIKFGKEYFIRCSIGMGFFVGHPKLEIVDNSTGKSEFESITEKK